MEQAPADLFPLAPQAADALFAEPWQARAFGMTMALHQGGHFTWPEWVEALSSEIAAAKARGDPDTGATYYMHWLAA
jgi:nitrile hydratase accessory protein